MKDRWTDSIDKMTNDFNQSFATLTISELNWKPNGDTWSIGQNIDHLIVINNTYYPEIKAVRAGTYKLPFLAKFDFLVSFFGRIILKSVQPGSKKKIKTFPVWEPTKSAVNVDILRRFEKNQNELKSFVLSSLDLLDQGTKISSPANRNIVYTLETAFDILVSHERRHFDQSLEVERMRNHE